MLFPAASLSHHRHRRCVDHPTVPITKGRTNHNPSRTGKDNARAVFESFQKDSVYTKVRLRSFVGSVLTTASGVTRNPFSTVRRNFQSSLLTNMASSKKVGYVSDIEGNYDYWRKYVEYSDVLVAEGSNVLLRDNCHFVCGGDVCDRGAGDIRVLRELLALKKLYPQRVHFVLGNRDINKLRLPAALHPSVLSQTPDVYWFDNSSQPGGNDYSLDNRANRLKWVS